MWRCETSKDTSGSMGGLSVDQWPGTSDRQLTSGAVWAEMILDCSDAVSGAMIKCNNHVKSRRQRTGGRRQAANGSGDVMVHDVGRGKRAGANWIASLLFSSTAATN